MIKQFLIVLIFTFIGIVTMVSGLYFGKYKQGNKKRRFERSKKITVSCGACPRKVAKACSGKT